MIDPTVPESCGRFDSESEVLFSPSRHYFKIINMLKCKLRYRKEIPICGEANLHQGQSVKTHGFLRKIREIHDLLE